MARVKDKVAIITGAGGGLGRAQARLLAKEGAKLVVTDIDEAGGKKVAEEVRRDGGEAIFIKHDVTSESDWNDVIQKTLAKFGKLDILVNNAGVLIRKKIEDISLEEWRWVMRVNVDGVFLGTKYAIGAMKKSGGGSIINISSIAGIVGTAGTSVYNASKAAVRLFTKVAALECSKAGYDYNIRVNSVHPGLVLTSMVDSEIKEEATNTGQKYEAVKKIREDWHPIGRLGEPEDIAYGVLYLASDESKFATGAELVIDGGLTAR
jgi:NAD(P)-dependent dehydrogenase (short-subunit alcohol dehydrogenase family)